MQFAGIIHHGVMKYVDMLCNTRQTTIYYDAIQTTARILNSVNVKSI